ncbi:hypothetical protein ACFROC_09975 [Nocardia tengchongensis]|uniref:hypothetical protein n=1 Tax=Nocardia tengchongensis TaxID=2055889 RepID=UPI003673B84D
MWSIDPPNFTVAETAQLCARGIRDKALAQRVLDTRDALTSNSDRLRKAVAEDMMHTLDDTACPVGPHLSATEMKALYTGQLAKRDRPARAHYDRIMSSAPFGLCIYCQYGCATTLDHVIPKTLVPGLAIDPWNLVPCCGPCNHTLGAAHSLEPDRQFLHPYAMPPLGRWLVGQVREQAPVTVEFFAAPDPDLALHIQQRVRHQFETLQLARYFTVVSAQQITTTTRTLARRWNAADHLTVREYLCELAQQEAEVDVNNRRAVVFEALADSDWYCREGFLT